ncbi:MAG: energy-coupling factor transporter ATPase [Bacilli bacterium]|nr:energy-coupling factor transporter ATPase [Bacilli bacterium]
MSFISINNLTFKYNRKGYVIDDLSLDIEKGEFVCILGHNGSGKSTLAKLIVGLLEPRKGHIYVNGLDINEEKDGVMNIDLVRKDMGIVFQNPDSQFVGITVKDDIAFGLENRRVSTEEMIDAVNKYSEKVGMKDFLDRNPEELSGGEKQRVAIAGILAMNTELIIFDEATSMLDPKGVREIIALIKKLKGQKTIISITHNLDEANFADRVIVLNKGKITLDGKPEDVFKQFDKLKEAGLDILNNMKLIDKINNSNIDECNKKVIEDALWELSFPK